MIFFFKYELLPVRQYNQVSSNTVFPSLRVQTRNHHHDDRAQTQADAEEDEEDEEDDLFVFNDTARQFGSWLLRARAQSGGRQRRPEIGTSATDRDADPMQRRERVCAGSPSTTFLLRLLPVMDFRS